MDKSGSIAGAGNVISNAGHIDLLISEDHFLVHVAAGCVDGGLTFDRIAAGFRDHYRDNANGAVAVDIEHSEFEVVGACGTGFKRNVTNDFLVAALRRVDFRGSGHILAFGVLYAEFYADMLSVCVFDEVDNHVAERVSLNVVFMIGKGKAFGNVDVLLRCIGNDYGNGFGCGVSYAGIGSRGCGESKLGAGDNEFLFVVDEFIIAADFLDLGSFAALDVSLEGVVAARYGVNEGKFAVGGAGIGRSR